jgi:hypothetical protein
VDQFFKLDSIVSMEINPNAFDQIFPHIKVGRDQGICFISLYRNFGCRFLCNAYQESKLKREQKKFTIQCNY